MALRGMNGEWILSAPNPQVTGGQWEDEYPMLDGRVGVTVLVNKFTGAPVIYDEVNATRSDVYEVFNGTLAEAEAAFTARQVQYLGAAGSDAGAVPMAQAAAMKHGVQQAGELSNL